jgi:hypothetical protein
MWVTFFNIKGGLLYSFHLCHRQLEIENLVILLIDPGGLISDGIDLTSNGYSLPGSVRREFRFAFWIGGSSKGVGI